MPSENVKRTQHAQESAHTETLSTVESEATRQRVSSSPYDGLSFSQTVEDDIKESMQAVGHVCRVAVVGVLFCGLGAIAIFLSVMFF